MGNNRYRPAKTRRDYEAFTGNKTVVFCDTETSGLNPVEDQILQLSAVKYALTEGELREVGTLDQFIMNWKDIPPEVSKVNHIDHLLLVDMGAPEEKEAFQKIKGFLDGMDILVCHNTPFDLSFIQALYDRQGEFFDVASTFDTMAMVRDLFSVYKMRSIRLGDVAKALGLTSGEENFHNSLDDVRMTQKIFSHLKGEYGKLPLPQDKKGHPIPRITSHWFWENPKNSKMKRIYFSTDCGKIFFEKFDRSFGIGTDGQVSMDDIDMESFIRNACRRLGVDDVEEMSHIPFPKPQ